MPEAAVHEYGDSMPRENEVGTSRQILPMEAESEARREEGLADDDFRLRVPSSDAGHHPASRRWVDNVSH